MSLRGFSFNGFDDLRAHVRGVIEDPWLVGSTLSTTRAERRRMRVTPPPNRIGYAVYYSDGASRLPSGADRREASCGNLRIKDGVVISYVATYLGNLTNNESEYEGLIRSLEHASDSSFPYICV